MTIPTPIPEGGKCRLCMGGGQVLNRHSEDPTWIKCPDCHGTGQSTPLPEKAVNSGVKSNRSESPSMTEIHACSPGKSDVAETRDHGEGIRRPVNEPLGLPSPINTGGTQEPQASGAGESADATHKSRTLGVNEFSGNEGTWVDSFMKTAAVIVAQDSSSGDKPKAKRIKVRPFQDAYKITHRSIDELAAYLNRGWPECVGNHSIQSFLVSFCDDLAPVSPAPSMESNCARCLDHGFVRWPDPLCQPSEEHPCPDCKPPSPSPCEAGVEGKTLEEMEREGRRLYIDANRAEYTALGREARAGNPQPTSIEDFNKRVHRAGLEAVAKAALDEERATNRQLLLSAGFELQKMIDLVSTLRRELEAAKSDLALRTGQLQGSRELLTASQSEVKRLRDVLVLCREIYGKLPWQYQVSMGKLEIIDAALASPAQESGV